jgi:hypothetical protein
MPILNTDASAAGRCANSSRVWEAAGRRKDAAPAEAKSWNEYSLPATSLRPDISSGRRAGPPVAVGRSAAIHRRVVTAVCARDRKAMG